MEDTAQNYISWVHLKGYKSIQDLEIDFKPGLNIIIGPNGSGKTNFLEFLFYARRHYFMDFPVSSSILIKRTDDSSTVYNWISENSNDKGVRFIFTDSEVKNGELILSRKWKVFDDKDRFEAPFEQKGDISNSSSLWEVPQLLGFGIPEPFNKSILEPTKVVFNISNNKLGLLNHVELEKTSFLFANIFIKNQYNVHKLDIEKQIIDKIDLNSLNLNLDSCSPIEQVRFDTKRVLQYVDEVTNTVVLENLVLQFFVAGKWLYWTQLSDGTKRLFFLIATITYFEQFILLEEPELGLHPDQLYKFMDFLKEQSKAKQIILTTHSPDVLNILDKNELDRIIVTRYDPEKGTKMHHLSESHIQKAHIYMAETGDVSDFWVHSNLEEYEAAS